MFVRRKTYEALEADLIKSRNVENHYKRRLIEFEESFPAEKRRLCDEMLPLVQSLVKAPGDWRSPDIPQEEAERRVRGLLEEIEAAGVNLPNAVAGLPK